MEYYIKLFELFARSVGLKINRKNYKTLYTRYKKDFIDWLNIYKATTFEYRIYLKQYFGIDVDDYFLAELGKGNIDSVVREEAFMITPYGYTFDDTYHKNSSLVIDDDIKLDFGTFTERANDIRTFITQNPYLNTDVMSKLKKLYEYHNKNIVLGMYGKINDEDRKAKIKILKQFRRNIDPDNQVFELDYNTKEDNYFCAITKK